jgi:hypothetical protein
VVTPSMHTPLDRIQSLRSLTVPSSTRTPIASSPSVYTLSELTPSPTLPPLSEHELASREPSVRQPSTERTPTLYSQSEGFRSARASTVRLPTERTLTVTTPTMHSPSARTPSEQPSERPPSTVPTIEDEELATTPRASRVSLPRSPVVSTPATQRPISITFPSPAPMTISDSSEGEDWIAGPSSFALSLGPVPSAVPTVAEMPPPALDRSVQRPQASPTLVRRDSVGSVDAVSTFSDVSPLSC